MPDETTSKELLEQIRQSKEAYIQALRQAFVDGLEPFSVWRKAISTSRPSETSPPPSKQLREVDRWTDEDDDIAIRLGELVYNDIR
ncbi:MAG: hypothetical protein QOJ19_1214 [Acidimicrobiia bacterium]|jgi:hypothetical protein|nr:hypothetical protein [Acidimicrobiia bacterium]